MKYSFIILFLFIGIGSVSSQSLYNQAFRLANLQQKISGEWVSLNTVGNLYVLYPDDEENTNVLTASSGRYVILQDANVIQFGFYESNGSTVYFQDQKTKNASVFQFMSSDSAEYVIYQYDNNSDKEFLYTLVPHPINTTQSDQWYVKYLFNLDEESLQSTFSSDLESLGLGLFYAPGTHHRYIRFYSTGNGRRVNRLEPLVQDSLRSNEVSKNSFQFGLVLTTKVSKSILFDSGIILNREGFKSSRIQNNSSSSYNLDYTFTYIDVPLTFRIYPIKKSLRLYLKLGVVPKFYSSNTILKTTFDQENNILGEEKSSFSDGQFVNLNMAGLVGLGLEYNIFSKAFLYVQPTYQSMLKAFASQQYVKRYLYHQNIQFGIKWSLAE